MTAHVRRTSVPLIALLLLAGFAASAAASSPSLSRDFSTVLSPVSASYVRLKADDPPIRARVTPALRAPARTQMDDLEALARRISFAGAILLTCDQVARSMDSVLERAQIRGGDGSSLRLYPLSHSGTGLLVVLSRPIDF